jgi:N-methylhydantoinase A
MYRIAIDVGGTFTDVVGADEHGKVTFVKAPSTPLNQAIGVMDGLERLAVSLDMSLPQLLGQCERIVHGMTVATNALLERKGAKVGLLTTAGHRDILEMREGLKPERYDLRLPRPEPIVPRHLRLGVTERMRADGTVSTELDETQLRVLVTRLKRAKVSSVAVCYLHSYANSAHEQRTRDILGELMPDAYVSLSSEVLPQIKEYQRVSTTAVNAYVGPLIRVYLLDLQARLRTAGYTHPVLVMLSHGGVAPIEEAVRIAAATVLSGPAGGLAGAGRVAQALGVPDLVPLDMGGTSTDISLVVGGEVALSSDRAIANERIALPSLDIITLGAGGGSIGNAQEGGLLRVGPQSAGAVPGPAAYGQGGMQATVTDASVVLGYLDPTGFLGGRTSLNVEAAYSALTRLGGFLGLDAVQAASGVHAVVNTHMAEGIRLATVRRGVDPRGFALLAFGGAAGLHATELARLLSIDRVVVPRMASVLSAWGMLSTQLRSESTQTYLAETDRLDLTAFRNAYDSLESQGRARMGEWFDGEVSVERFADMRYGEQIFEIDVALAGVDMASTALPAQLKAAFEKRHEALYTYSLPDQAPVVVNVRVATVGRLPQMPLEQYTREHGESNPVGTRRVFLGDWIDVPVFDFDTLSIGQQLTGPAVVESATTTVLLRPGDRAEVTPQRWLDIRVMTK